MRTGRRVRPRTARSFTATKTRRRRPTGVTSHGDNASSSGCRLGPAFMRGSLRTLAKKIVQPRMVHANTSGRLTASLGLQTVAVFNHMVKSDLTAMETASNGGVATAVPCRFVLRTGKHRLTLRNQTNTNIRMTLYDIVCVRDPPDATLDTPIEAWGKGLTDYGVTNTYNVVGQTPMRSPEFRQYYRIKKVTQLSMEPGQQHEHTVIDRWNRVINSTRFQNSVSNAIAGLTYHCMVVFHGSLVHESATPGTVTTSSGVVDYMFAREYTYGWLETTTSSYAVTNGLATTVADPDFMGETGDADANIVDA